MRSVKLICVGKMKERFYIDAFAEYAKRLGRYCTFEVDELPELGSMEREGREIERHIPSGAYCIAMCIEGKQLSSPELSALLERQATGGFSRLAVIIGGSDGMAPFIKQQAHFRLSMSPMTFPHHLARVMVAEQLYRAFTIINGEKYHK